MSENTENTKKEFLELKKQVGTFLEHVDTSKNSHLQNYMYFVYYPLFSFAESVIILCENGKYQSARVLLRSLIEAHINIIYHQIDDSEYRLAISAKSGFDEKIKGIREIKELVKKHSNLESQDPANVFNKTWLHEAEQWAERERQAIMKGNNLEKNDQDLDLKSKALKCDLGKVKGSESGHFERMYNLIYRQLSPSTHLDIDGLQGFVTEKGEGKYLFSDGNDNDARFLIVEAVGICVAFSRDLYDLGIIKEPVTATIPHLEELFRKAVSE